jgi:5S rRNA maturation endonuclease (ribonuclease M5)
MTAPAALAAGGAEWTASSAFELVIARLEQAGSRVTGNGRQRSAQCPAHDDSDPSMSVTDGMDRVLVYCHVCELDDVLAALGEPRLTLADLFNSPLRRSDGPRRRVVATYLYTDEHGETLFAKDRLEPKSFRIRRPDGRGGWTWGLAPETRRVLYRLPEVLAAPRSACVFIVEGEKDADCLARAGEIATCNYEGASSSGQSPKWRAEYSPALAGRDVLIIADRDDDGRAHARYVASCLQGIASFVWIAEAAAGKDASDHLSAGLAVTDFAWWDR